MAITRVQGNARGTSLTNSISVTMTSTPTSGDMLIATIGTYSSTAFATVSSISETGVTWTRQAQETYGSGSYWRVVEIWAGVVGSGALTSITINLAVAADYGAIADVCEYSGLLTSGFLDKTAVNTGSSTAPDTGTTATTTQPNELWIGNTGVAASPQTNPTNGFTLLDGVSFSSFSVAYLENIVNAIGTANSGTTIPAGVGWVGCIATFKASVIPMGGGIIAQAKIVGII